jgi:DNA-binding XRE family transcriptional regulator
MGHFGKKISQFRKLKQMTQKEFAKLAEITYRHYQDIEADKTNIRISTAFSIASILKVPMKTLFDENHTVELVKAGINEPWQIIESFPIGICIADLDGKLLYLNQFFKSHLIGNFEDSSTRPLYVWELLPSEQMSHGKLDFLKVIRERPDPKPSQRVYRGPENKEIQVSIFWDYVLDEKGNPKGFISGVLPIDS